tara:strand:- start:218 stop:1315 length:1098 start_codon:yes stop_codon:yes gene_type:complete
LADEKNKILKVGLLAPFSGEYKDLGQSIMLSLQLALNEIGDDNITILPRDSGSNNEELLINSIEQLKDEGVKVIIGPINYKDFPKIKKYSDLVFISPSNTDPKIQNNIISIGISLESQIKAITEFIKKQKKAKTIILYPKNEYTNLIDAKLSNLQLNNYKVFKYNPDPKKLTGDIEKLTNYKQRKINLQSRVKMLENKDDEASKIELKKLEQRYTIGKINFDSVIIIDFGNSLKSVLTSLVFVDVDQSDVLITTVNQWFDKSIFLENSIDTLYYPSINQKNFIKYKDKFSKVFGTNPSEITILTYDALGLIYYVWKKNDNKIDSLKDFVIKERIKGKIGAFNFKNGQFLQELDIYKVSNKKFKKF